VNKRGADDTFSADDQRLAEAFAARVAVAVRLAAGDGQERTHSPVEDDAGASAELTSREIEVLRLVAHGMSDAQVADKLVVSLRTLHSHLRSPPGRLAERSGSLGRRARSGLARGAQCRNLPVCDSIEQAGTKGTNLRSPLAG
jgi:FixJ family two-component response regulator